MKQEIADKWAEALESAEYPQVQGSLCSLNGNNEVIGYCCLGVLCEIYQKEVGDLSITHSTYNRCYDASASSLPIKVRDWAGMKDSCGTYKNNRCENEGDFTLMRDNDANNKSFKEIAQTIRENVETL